MNKDQKEILTLVIADLETISDIAVDSDVRKQLLELADNIAHAINKGTL